jgi:hypothetical protein
VPVVVGDCRLYQKPVTESAAVYTPAGVHS